MLKYNDRMPYNLLDIYNIEYDDIECFDEYQNKAIVRIDADEETIYPMNRGYDTTEQTEFFEFIRDLICTKYNLITSMDGMLHNQIDEVDEFIDDCVEPLDFYGEKIPASDAFFNLHSPMYTGYAQGFFINQLNEFFETLLKKGEHSYAIEYESILSSKKVVHNYLFKLIDWNEEEESV